MKFVFWYWREHPDFEPNTKLDTTDTKLVDTLKKWEISYTVFQYVLHQDKEFISLCKSLKDEKIVYFVPEECRLFSQDCLEIIHCILEKNNCTLEIWLGNFEESQCRKTIGIELPKDRISIVNWNTFLMYRSFYHFTKKHFKKDCKTINIDKPFVCLNNRVTSYRCKMMESLARNNLIDSGYVSWLKTLDDKIYDDIFEYFDNKPIYLNKQKVIDHKSSISEIINEEEYFKGFVNIIPEGEVWLKDLSEKTFYAILHKKPFLILGAPRIHKKLQELGFLLYDDIFDYTFDDKEDVDKRISGIIANLKAIKNKDYNSLYRKMLPKLEFNYNKFIEILEDKNSVPNSFFDYLNSTQISKNEQQCLQEYYECIKTFNKPKP